MTYSVVYNAKTMAIYKTLKAAVNFIAKKGYKNDDLNMCYIQSREGGCYHPNGEEYKENEY